MKIFIAILLAAFGLAVPVHADGIMKDEWPSIIFYGESVNQKISGPLYWEGQEGRMALERESGVAGRNSGGYGAISPATRLPRTELVGGYTRKNGTYVQPYYRSRR